MEALSVPHVCDEAHANAGRALRVFGSCDGNVRVFYGTRFHTFGYAPAGTFSDSKAAITSTHTRIDSDTQTSAEAGGTRG